MRWFGPPTRREISLFLFCSTVFTFAYNLENTLRFVGFDAPVAQAGILSRLGYVSTSILYDGRKSLEWRDDLDDKILGNAEWNDGEVLDARLDGQSLGVGPHSAMWISKQLQDELWPPTNEPDVSSGFWRWNDEVPTTSLLQHSLGYTILDQVIIHNKTVYIVTDEPESFPNVNSITTRNWQVISSQNARSVIGRYGGRIHGVSWMCTEFIPQNTTLLALWSMYSTLGSPSSLPPPSRLILPEAHVFLDPDFIGDDKKENLATRVRSPTGFHPFLPKVAFPHMGILYQEDWADYMGMEVPYVIQRLVVADYYVAGSAGLAAVLQKSSSASPDWWEPVRRDVAKFFGNYEDHSARKSVTYIHRSGAMLEEDHKNLVHALNKMGTERGIDVNIVEAVDKENNAEWGVRMAAVVKSDVILSVQGPEILDGVFLRPSSVSTMIEMFPPNVVFREHESIANSLGINYIAWADDRKLSSYEISRGSDSRSYERGRDVHVDANALITAILDVLT